MQTKLISDDAGRTFALRLEEGEAIMPALEAFARENHISAAQLTAIGAFRTAIMGFYDIAAKDYVRIEAHEQVEVLVLAGNIAVHLEEPKVHAHVVLGRRNGTTLGGHLLEAIVDTTLEVMLIESPGHLRRRMDDTTGLPLLDL
jgi:uncharacterized protein